MYINNREFNWSEVIYALFICSMDTIVYLQSMSALLPIFIKIIRFDLFFVLDIITLLRAKVFKI